MHPHQLFGTDEYDVGTVYVDVHRSVKQPNAQQNAQLQQAKQLSVQESAPAMLQNHIMKTHSFQFIVKQVMLNISRQIWQRHDRIISHQLP